MFTLNNINTTNEPQTKLLITVKSMVQNGRNRAPTTGKQTYKLCTNPILTLLRPPKSTFVPFINPYTFKGEIFHGKLRKFIFFKLEETDRVSRFLWNSIFFIRNLHIFGRFSVPPVNCLCKKISYLCKFFSFLQLLVCLHELWNIILKLKNRQFDFKSTHVTFRIFF